MADQDPFEYVPVEHQPEFEPPLTAEKPDWWGLAGKAAARRMDYLGALKGVWEAISEPSKRLGPGVRDISKVPPEYGKPPREEEVEEMVPWGAGTALGMVGAGTFSTKGTLGAAGARPVRSAKLPEETGYVGEIPEPAALPSGAGAEGERGLPAGGAGRDPRLEEAQRAATEAAGSRTPLTGTPTKPIELGNGEYFVPGPHDVAHTIAEEYMRENNLPYTPIREYAPIVERRSREIADAYEQMPHAPDDPKVQAAYRAMVDETLAQWKAIEKTGLDVDFIQPGQPDPYHASPRLANKDVRDNNHLWVYPTDIGIGESVGAESAAAALASDPFYRNNPLFEPSPVTIKGKQLLNNDVFRIVHDYFGHFKDGNGFRAAGEENAWRSHSAMYSDLARPAMTAETRGQNSWVNYGPHGEKNRTAKTEDTVFAQQKMGLLPDWVINEGARDPLPVKDPKLRAKAEAIRGKWAKFAENYPETGPPALVEKLPGGRAGKEIPYNTKEEAEALIATGKAFFSKKLTPEAAQFAKDRSIIDKDMEVNGYTPYYDPAKRADVNPQDYPTSFDMSRDVMPKKPEVIAKYNKLYDTPEARARLKAGFKEGLKIPESDRWYYMKQLQDEYIKHLGPTAGRLAFKKEFADAMAATTGGNKPEANWLMAHYAEFTKKRGIPFEQESYNLPYPVGGRYGVDKIPALIEKAEREGGFGPDNPKRHDFSAAFAGHKVPVIDEQMSGAIKPGMTLPEFYSPASRVVGKSAKAAKVDPRGFQDVAWAGIKKIAHDMEQIRKYPNDPKKRIPFKYEGPMISHVNASIERTHRLTGMSRHDVVKRGAIGKQIPMYGVGAAGLLAPQLLEERAAGGPVWWQRAKSRRGK
jgi:hypothetical protein